MVTDSGVDQPAMPESGAIDRIADLEASGTVLILANVVLRRERGRRGRGFCLPGNWGIAVRAGRGQAFIPMPFAVDAPVIDAVRIMAARVFVVFRLSFVFSAWGVEASAQEFFGGGQPVVGLEVGEIALHDVHQEADGDAAVVSFLAYQGGEVLVEASFDRLRTSGG